MGCCKKNSNPGRPTEETDTMYSCLRFIASVIPYIYGLIWLVLTMASYEDKDSSHSACVNSINTNRSVVAQVLELNMGLDLKMTIAFTQIAVGGLYVLCACNIAEYRVNDDERIDHVLCAVTGAFVTGIMIDRISIYVTIATALMYFGCAIILANTNKKSSVSREGVVIANSRTDEQCLSGGIPGRAFSLVTAEPVMGTV